MNTIDCFKLLYAVLPLLLGLILIMRTGDVNKSMLYGNFLGLVLYNVMVCIKALVSTEGSYSGLFLAQMVFESSYKTISECIRLFRGIILDKASIATAVFVLFVMVKLICGSNALQYIDQAAVRFVTSKVRFLTVFLVLSLLFSIDDYLCCVGVAAVTATITARHGISKEKAAYMICLLAVALCTLMPCSSWNPVIRSAIGSFVPVGGVLLMIPGLLMGGMLPNITILGLFYLLMLIGISTIGFTLYNKLLTCNPVGKIAIWNSLIPVVGAVTSCLCLSEEFQWKYALAATMTTAGIYIINKGKK